MGRASFHQKAVQIAHGLAHSKYRQREQINVEKQEKAKNNPENWGINEDVIMRARHRGEQLTINKGRPVRRIYSGGLWWLYSHGRITKPQADAGKIYGECYERSKGLIKSQLDGSVHSGYNVNFGKESSLAVLALEGPMKALSNSIPLISVCNKVCGEGYKIRELARDHRGIVNRTRALALESNLSTALDILAVHFGVISKAKALAL